MTFALQASGVEQGLTRFPAVATRVAVDSHAARAQPLLGNPGVLCFGLPGLPKTFINE